MKTLKSLILAACMTLVAVPSYSDIARPDTDGDTLLVLQNAIIAAGFANAEIDWDDRSIAIPPENASDLDLRVFPDNLHRGLQSAESDAERQVLLDDFVRNLLNTPAASDEAFTPEQILPRLQHVDYVNAGREKTALVTRDFVGDLLITYVVDFGNHARSLSPEEQTELGLNARALHTIALENLMRHAEPLAIEGTESGVYYFVLDGFYENALLLDASLWENIISQIGPIAVTVPTRDFVMIAPREDEGAVQVMLDARNDALANDAYSLSEHMFTWDDGAWRVWPE